MRKALRNVGIILLMLLVVAAGVLLVHRRQSRNALARYKAELRAKGEKLTFAELAFTPSTDPAYVASRLFFATNSFPEVNDADVLKDAIPMEYVSAGKARVAWRGRLHLQSTNEDEAFTPGDWGKFSSNVIESSPVLAPYREMLLNPAPDTGQYYRDSFDDVVGGPPLPRLAGARHLGQLFANTAIENLHQGAIEDANANINSLVGMSKLYEQEPGLLPQLVRMANARNGFAVTWEALQAAGWNEDRLAGLQKKWEEVDFFVGFERALLRYRADAAIMFEAARNTNVREFRKNWLPSEYNADGTSQTRAVQLGSLWENYILPAVYLKFGLDGDEMFEIRRWSDLIDSIRLLKSGKPWAEISEPLMQREAAETDDAIAHRQKHQLSLLFGIRGLGKQLSHVAEMETELRLTVTAIAIKRYELQYGKPPENLAALVPEFLAAVPMDPMSGKPLCYRLNNGGKVTLYSVGEDGKDDGGDPTPKEQGGKFGLWEGKDAVWPTAATDEESAAADAAASKK